MKIIAELGLSVLVGLLVLAALLGCDENSGGRAHYEQELAETKARLDETRQRITAEQEKTTAEMARSRRQLQAERERSRERARELQRRTDLASRQTEAAEADFSVAIVISLSAVLGTFLLLHLLLREMTARKALGRFLRHITGRNSP